MRSRLALLGLVIIVLGAGVSVVISSTESKKGKALQLVSKVCYGDGQEELSSQAKANLAAQASHLDPQWTRLSEAANASAGFQGLFKVTELWRNQSGNDLAKISYEANIMLAQFLAECSRVPGSSNS